MVDLSTTNLFLGIIALVSILEALAIIVGGLLAFRMVRQIQEQVRRIEERQFAPIMRQVEGILEDVRSVTARVHEETERVNHQIHRTIERVDETADLVRARLGDRIRRVVAAVRGARAAVESIISSLRGVRPPRTASTGLH